MTGQTHRTGDLLTRIEVAERLNVTPRTLYRWELSRTGPPSIKLGRAAYYRREALEAWLLSLEGSGSLQPVARRQP